jgi:oligopeptidase B
MTVFEYDLRSRTKTVLKQTEIPGGYDPSQYHSERIFARSHDGVQVPISIVYRQDFNRDGTQPLYLYGYGSYGASLDPGFSTNRLSLLDRGFVYAIAHIRGGSELGRHWYESGKFLQKKNTFLDFVACAEHLIAEKYTSAGNIAIAGGSAGGLLVGATINLKPELFKAAIADVPFVDVLNTMLDADLPLTQLEYDEWGNPADEEFYRYIRSYSPYDNVEAKAYPHLLITAGLNDPRVTYWEPAKWTAKLRSLKTDDNLLLLKTNLDSGHGGASGRYEYLKDIALEYTFLLSVFLG